MVSLTYSSGRYINGRNSANLELLIDKNVINIPVCEIKGSSRMNLLVFYKLLMKLLLHTIIAKTSKQVAILRKLNFKVSRNFLETMYLIFTRPLLEYAGEVWDNCTLADAERLEKIQLEAAHIVTGLTYRKSGNFGHGFILAYFMTCLTNHHYIFLLVLELLIYYMLIYVKNVVASYVIYLDVI